MDIYCIILLCSLICLILFLILYLFNSCFSSKFIILSNFENPKFLSKSDYLDSYKSKFYSLRSGENEKSLINKINSYIQK